MTWTPAEAERYLLSLELFGMRFGLERMRRLMTVLGSPTERLSAVQIVGTNGKSSTTRMVAALLAAHGLRTGAYVSPHLESFAERIEIDGQAPSAERFAAAVERAAHAAVLVERGLPEGDRVTQFESLTAAAFWLLAEAGIEAAVVEAGLGGRYDATSVIDRSVLTLTNVGLEHTRWLGPTERHVAEEKLAVTPERGVVLVGRLGSDALEVAERLASERDARLLLFGRDFGVESERAESFAVRTPTQHFEDVRLGAPGRFQRANFALALATAEVKLGEGGRSLDRRLVAGVARSLRLPGRLEVIARDPLVVLDGAHNLDAVRALRDSLDEVVGSRDVVAVISVLDDKDAAAMLAELLPVCSSTVFTRSSHSRALPPATLESLSRQLGGPPSEIAPDPIVALARARELARREGAVLVTGSIYLLSDLVRAGTARAEAAQ